MIHGISERAWIQYLDKQVEASERERIEAHLAGCGECREFCKRMARTDELLHRLADEQAERFPLQNEQLHINLAKVLARVLDAEAREGALSRPAITQRMKYLEEILAAMCGEWTAVNALRVAANSSLAGAHEQVTQDNWMSFLKRLTSITSVFCGDAGARLLWEYGNV
jgi:predicted anti-sigma-YlaC factor YlaD